MKTEVIKIYDVKAQDNDLRRAADIIRSGGLVVLPTETVYGLGGDGTDADAAKKIYAAKGRPSDNPLIIHISKPEDAEGYAHTNGCYYRLAKAFMPGPLTVIMPKKDTVPASVTGGLDSVAVRCPSHPIANKLIELADVPIAAPSANISGKPSPTRAEHVIDDLDGRVDMIIDGGECDIGLESTIVKIDGEDKLTLLRPGAITYDALLCVCSEVEIAPAVLEQLGENERPLSPGMKYRHYAPSAEFILLDGNDDDTLAFMKSEQKSSCCGLIVYTEECPELDEKNVICIGDRDNLASHAKALFSALRTLDRMGVDKIYAHLPKKDGIGLALYNRMIRASAHTVKKIENNTKNT